MTASLQIAQSQKLRKEKKHCLKIKFLQPKKISMGLLLCISCNLWKIIQLLKKDTYLTKALVIPLVILLFSKKKGKADVPFTKKVPPPRKSQFSHNQQRRYVYLYKKYSHKTTIDTTEEEKVEIRELQVDSEKHR